MKEYIDYCDIENKKNMYIISKKELEEIELKINELINEVLDCIFENENCNPNNLYIGYITPEFMVRGIPTLMIFKNGKLIDTKVGALPKNSLIEWVNNSINKS